MRHLYAVSAVVAFFGSFVLACLIDQPGVILMGFLGCLGFVVASGVVAANRW